MKTEINQPQKGTKGTKGKAQRQESSPDFFVPYCG
jgi:hypothetical protein